MPSLFTVASGTLFGFVDGEQNVGFLCHVGQADHSALTQRMMAGQPQAAFGVEQGFGDDIRMSQVGCQYDGHVEAPLQQADFNGLTLLFVYFDGDVGVPMLQTLQVVRQEVADDRVTGRQVQHSVSAVVRQRAVQSVIYAALDYIRAIQEMPSGVGQIHALGGAQKQLLHTCGRLEFRFPTLKESLSLS
ncbi:hypothetical protein D3C84_866880 [compost metagenome]